MTHARDRLVVVDYDASWPACFAAFAARVRTALGDPVLRIEHVGSTAVPGLPAKPIVDMDVVIASSADLPEVIGRLAILGYVHEGDLGIAFRWPSGEARHHLYVVTEDALELRRHLTFRNALRGDPALRDRYAELKRSLASRHAEDRVAYMEGKSAFIEAVLRTNC